MRFFSWRFLRVWQRNRDVFFRLWHSEAPGSIAEPIIVLLAFGAGMGAYIGLIDGQQYMVFLAPGVVAAYAMFSASFECTYASFVRLDYQYTFDAILATPLSAEDITAGEIFWGATRALMTASIVLIVAAGFQLIPSPWAILIPVVAFLEGLMKELFPEIFDAFNEFARTKNWTIVERAVNSGYRTATRYARTISSVYSEGKQSRGMKWTEKELERQLLIPLGIHRQ